jgi:hypothetical protein
VHFSTPVARLLRNRRISSVSQITPAFYGAKPTIIDDFAPQNAPPRSARRRTLPPVARLGDIVFDCRHPASLARFWASVLDGYRVAPYDDAELERLRARGIDDPEDDPAVLVEGPPGAPGLWFQRVPEAKIGKNRVHLDLHGDVADLVGKGATVLRAADPDTGLTVLADPEGNEFCAEPAESAGG